MPLRFMAKGLWGEGLQRQPTHALGGEGAAQKVALGTSAAGAGDPGGLRSWQNRGSGLQFAGLALPG